MAPDSPDHPDESFAALFEQSSKGAPRARAPRVGETLDATVVQVGKDTVFVDLGSHRQGWIEALDLRAPDGTMRTAPGEKLRARVVAVDERGVRLAPTVEAAAAAGAAVTLGAGAREEGVKVAVGQVVNGTVDRVESYGVFLQIDGTKGRAGRGLVPVAELGTPRGADLRKHFPQGTKMRGQIIGREEGKMRMSVRALEDDEERAEVESFREKEKQASPAGNPRGFGTLGDLLNKRKNR